tara:strand:- start:62 stop:475 length:414 start_codon:yes stop_codon:yes gene_type:complete
VRKANLTESGRVDEIKRTQLSLKEAIMSFRVDNVEHYFNTLGDRFTREGSRGVHATYQFELEGSGTWHINISDGDFELHEGASELPTTTLKMKGEDYIKMVNGDLNGQMAFMTGKLKISGQIPMAMKLKSIFPQAEK